MLVAAIIVRQIENVLGAWPVVERYTVGFANGLRNQRSVRRCVSDSPRVEQQNAVEISSRHIEIVNCYKGGLDAIRMIPTWIIQTVLFWLFATGYFARESPGETAP